MSLKTILLDLDGVIVDFVRSAMTLHNVTYKGEEDYPVSCGWDVVEACNAMRKKQWKGYLTLLSDRAFWDMCGTETFWASLSPYPGALEFVKDLSDLFDPERIVIATSATDHPGTLAGKYRWIKNHLPKWKRRYMVGTPKWALANQQSLLIDDSERNISQFVVEGGAAVIVPRPWNSYKFTGSPYAMILEETERLIREWE
jgi:5'(3')-deoxyribonucleotidase